jgi:hypothetical protein
MVNRAQVHEHLTIEVVLSNVVEARPELPSTRTQMPFTHMKRERGFLKTRTGLSLATMQTRCRADRKHFFIVFLSLS